MRNLIFAISLIVINIAGYGQAPHIEPACAGSIQKYGVTGLPGSTYDWFVDIEAGKVIAGDNTDTATIQWYRAIGDHTIEVDVTIDGNDSCIAITRAIVKITTPNIDLGPDKEICQGDSLIIDMGNLYESPHSFVWNNVDTLTDSIYIAKQTGEIVFQVTDNNRCVNADSIYVKVNPLPVVQFDTRQVSVCDNSQPYLIIDAIDLIKSNDGISKVEWNFDGITTNENSYTIGMSQSKLDTLSITLTNLNMCSSSDTLFILPCDLPSILVDMPNTIIPKGAPENQTWKIPHMELFPNAVLEIFDKLGRLIYRTTNVYGEPWDGKSKGKPVPMDSYYYVLDLKYGGVKAITGTVNLIR